MFLEFFFTIFLSYLVSIIIRRILNSNNNFWPSRGIRFLSLSDVTTFYDFYIRRSMSIVELDTAYYKFLKNHNEQVGGVMELRNPVLIVADLDLAQRILVKDFEFFEDRRSVHIHTTDPLYRKMLINLNGEEWKRTRAVLSPTFSTGKLRRMSPNFFRCANHLVNYIKEKMKSGESEVELEVHDASTRYIVDVILNTAFGIETTEVSNDSWYQMTRISQQPPLSVNIQSWILVNFPRFAKFFNLTFMQRDAVNFFAQKLRDTHKHRLLSGYSRDDFLQLMIEASQKPSGKAFTQDFITAQSVSFFFAAFEAPGSLLSFATYMIAMFPEVQRRLQDEVDNCLNGTKGADELDIYYEAIVHNLPYLTMFVSEVLRMYPPGARTERLCTKDYVIPGTESTIPKGTLVSIPIYALQNDEEYFEDPNKFDPERFSLANKSKVHPHWLMAFGQGPRNCIGMRFALLETKVCLFYIIKHFELLPAQNSPSILGGFLRRDGLYLKYSMRKSNCQDS